ncbi:MAG: hypothetical protein ACRDG8_10205 [Actinomycetota bacterium]
MRVRLFSAGVAGALCLGVLSAAPAVAAYAVDSITFPGDGSEFYSPFSGPATVTFSFDEDAHDATFELRLRPIGGSAIRRKEILVDPDTQSSPRTVSFSWPALWVSSARTYQVAVYRNGALQGSPESFQLRSPLVTITGASPNPFLPWIDDGFKDTTRIHYRLTEAADAEVRVFRANSGGTCCGVRVLDEEKTGRPAGSNSWVWDGKGNGTHAGNLPKGDYFVRIKAEDPENVVGWSKPFRVRIARTYRAMATRSKPGPAPHHTGWPTPYVLGGDCIVFVPDEALALLCQGARVTVSWRWALATDQRIERSSVVLDSSSTDCPPVGRSVAHSKHGSSFTVKDNLPGRSVHCRVVETRITYSFAKAS